MSRLRCRLGLHAWRDIPPSREGRRTMECEYCRYRYTVRPAREAANAAAINKADRAPS